MINVKNLHVKYGDFEALRGISFSVASGEIIGYLGPNGAGKSTTVKVLTGLLKPLAGDVSVAGFDLLRAPQEVHRRLGYVPEHAAAYDLLTGNEYLELLKDLHEMEEEHFQKRRQTLIEGFQLEKVANRYISTYSKGQRQKIVLTAALLHEPEVLILDEPFTGLDVNAVRTVKAILQKLAEKGRTIFISSHSLDLVERMCQRVFIIHNGQIIADSPTADLLELSKAHTLESVFAQLTQSDNSESSMKKFLDEI